MQRALDLETVAISNFVVRSKVAGESKRSLRICLWREFPFFYSLLYACDQQRVSTCLSLLYAAIARHRHFDKYRSKNARLPGQRWVI